MQNLQIIDDQDETSSLEYKREDPQSCNSCKLAKTKPKIPIYGAYNLKNTLAVGEEYSWCSCGYSKEQPWCDKTCELDLPELVDEEGNQAFKPCKFKVQKDQTLWSICGCKYTRTPPLCDGTHGPMPAHPDYAPCRCKDDNKGSLDW